MVLEENTKKEITDISSNIDCKREQGEKQKIIDLGQNLEGLNTPEKIDDRVECKNLLGEQKLGNSDQTLEDFLKKDIKSMLVQKKAEWDTKSNTSNTPEGVQAFINSIGKEIQDIFGNKNDKVAILQVYLNSICDFTQVYAKIPYDSKKYDYKQGENKRLFIDGILGPHTYNALWLATFGEELPKIELVRKQSYAFDRNEPRIIGKDLPYIPLTLPGLDKSGNVESSKTIEIIDNPKIKGAIELLYLFYDGVSKKDNLGIDIDDRLMKIMTNPKLYNNDNGTANSLNGYIIAIKDLNREIAGDKSDFKRGRDVITNFINDNASKEDSELAILNTLEYDVKSHEYVANYIAEKRIDISQEPYKSKMEDIKINLSDKDFVKYEKDVEKKWSEQKSVQKKFILETFYNAKSQATTPELQQELCQMFGVDDVSKVTSSLILKKTDEAIEIAKKDFESQMLDTYFTKRFLEGEIRADKANLDGLGNYSGKDRYKVLFADIQGIGYANPSSEKVDIMTDIARMVGEEAACFAIGMATAGFGGILLKAALYGRRAIKIGKAIKYGSEALAAGKRVSRFQGLKYSLQYANKAEKVVRAQRALTWGGKAINVTTFAAGVGVEGVSFYQATNAMQNILDGKPTFEGRDNIPENLKSIAMMGTLKFVNKLVATSKIVSVGGKEFNINPFNKLATKNTEKIFTRAGKIAGESLLVGGPAIFAVEHMGDAIIEEDEAHPWTKEEFIQAVLMYMIFRGYGERGKFKIAKNKKTGKPEIQKENPKAKAEQKKEMTSDQKAEYDALKADKRAYIEKQQEINKKMKANEEKIKQLESKRLGYEKRLSSMSENSSIEITTIEGKNMKLIKKGNNYQVEHNSTNIENPKNSPSQFTKEQVLDIIESNPNYKVSVEPLKFQDDINSIKLENQNLKTDWLNITNKVDDINIILSKEYLPNSASSKSQVKEEPVKKELNKEEISDLKSKKAKLEEEYKKLRENLNKLNKKVEEVQVKGKEETIKKEATPKKIEKKSNPEKNQDLINKQNEIQKLADDFDAQMMSDKGITIDGVNYKLIYKPNMTQNASRKGEWKYIEDGVVKTSIKGDAGILPNNSTGNNIRANYNKLRNKYIESGTSKSLVEAKIIPINKPSLLYWIKENPGIAATGALLVTIGGGTLIYKITSKSDEEIEITPVTEPEKIEQKDVINLIEGENGQYFKLE